MSFERKRLQDENIARDEAISRAGEQYVISPEFRRSQWLSTLLGATGGGSGGASRLGELADVEITSPANDQVLSYDDTDMRWENKSLADVISPFGDDDVLDYLNSLGEDAWKGLTSFGSAVLSEVTDTYTWLVTSINDLADDIWTQLVADYPWLAGVADAIGTFVDATASGFWLWVNRVFGIVEDDSPAETNNPDTVGATHDTADDTADYNFITGNSGPRYNSENYINTWGEFLQAIPDAFWSGVGGFIQSVTGEWWLLVNKVLDRVTESSTVNNITYESGHSASTYVDTWGELFTAVPDALGQWFWGWMNDSVLNIYDINASGTKVYNTKPGGEDDTSTPNVDESKYTVSDEVDSFTDLIRWAFTHGWSAISSAVTGTLGDIYAAVADFIASTHDQFWLLMNKGFGLVKDESGPETNTSNDYTEDTAIYHLRPGAVANADGTYDADQYFNSSRYIRNWEDFFAEAGHAWWVWVRSTVGIPEGAANPVDSWGELFDWAFTHAWGQFSSAVETKLDATYTILRDAASGINDAWWLFVNRYITNVVTDTASPDADGNFDDDEYEIKEGTTRYTSADYVDTFENLIKWGIGSILGVGTVDVLTDIWGQFTKDANNAITGLSDTLTSALGTLTSTVATWITNVHNAFTGDFAGNTSWVDIIQSFLGAAEEHDDAWQWIPEGAASYEIPAGGHENSMYFGTFDLTGVDRLFFYSNDSVDPTSDEAHIASKNQFSSQSFAGAQEISFFVPGPAVAAAFRFYSSKLSTVSGQENTKVLDPWVEMTRDFFTINIPIASTTSIHVGGGYSSTANDGAIMEQKRRRGSTSGGNDVGDVIVKTGGLELNLTEVAEKTKHVPLPNRLPIYHTLSPNSLNAVTLDREFGTDPGSIGVACSDVVAHGNIVRLYVRGNIHWYRMPFNSSSQGRSASGQDYNTDDVLRRVRFSTSTSDDITTGDRPIPGLPYLHEQRNDTAGDGRFGVMNTSTDERDIRLNTTSVSVIDIGTSRIHTLDDYTYTQSLLRIPMSTLTDSALTPQALDEMYGTQSGSFGWNLNNTDQGRFFVKVNGYWFRTLFTV